MVPAAPGESFGFQPGLVAPAGPHPSALRAATFPKGEGKAVARLLDWQVFIFLRKWDLLFMHRRYSAMRKRRQRRAGFLWNRAGWSRLPEAAVARLLDWQVFIFLRKYNLLYMHRRYSAMRKRRQHRAGFLWNRAGWSRLPDLIRQP